MFHRGASVVRDVPTRRHRVPPYDAIGWIGQPLGELCVGREQQESAGRQIETPDSDEPGTLVTQHVEDGATPLRIGTRRDSATRLVEGDCPPVAFAGGRAAD